MFQVLCFHRVECELDSPNDAQSRLRDWRINNHFPQRWVVRPKGCSVCVLLQPKYVGTVFDIIRRHQSITLYSCRFANTDRLQDYIGIATVRVENLRTRWVDCNVVDFLLTGQFRADGETRFNSALRCDGIHVVARHARRCSEYIREHESIADEGRVNLSEHTKRRMMMMITINIL